MQDMLPHSSMEQQIGLVVRQTVSQDMIYTVIDIKYRFLKNGNTEK